ncbi:tetratricopeptide repeat protein [Thomasclavelia spiroformis]|uniref:tetratricopeptide repeat protein n=1 Tax=Thomasclavelia spiroformis TaxID=29348 RepID=UPI00265F222D|nr:hypothetical protein [Thomasclavelia spiroformis]
MKNEIRLKPVFNFNFSVNMIFRCTEQRYAKQLLNGKIFFNKPENWIKEERLNGKGRGDELEGVFLCTKDTDCSEFINNLKESEDIEYFNKDGYIFFRRKAIKQIWCVCFYGLKSNAFKKSIDKKGRVHRITQIDKSYFDSFSNNISRENYDTTLDIEKPCVIFINNPNLFLSRIKKFFLDMGLSDKEYIISPVEYIDKYNTSISMLEYPQELLLKDRYFENQSEIIINTKNKKFCKYMKDNNNVINIGSIADIANIYDYYFDNLLIERTWDGIAFNLPKPVEQPLEEISIIKFYEFLAKYMSEYRLTYVEKEKIELKKKIKELKEYMEKRFNISVSIDLENYKIYIYNANKEIFDEMNKVYKDSKKEQLFRREAEKLIDENDFEKLEELCDRYMNDSDFELLSKYYKGKSYQKQAKYDFAIKAYIECLEKNYNFPNILNDIAICYGMNNNSKEAIKFYKMLQDEIGYNHEIYMNIGIEYINLGDNIKAIEMFDKSLKLKESSKTYYNRYVAKYRLKEYVEARNDLKNAILLEPENSQYRDQLEQINKICKYLYNEEEI